MNSTAGRPANGTPVVKVSLLGPFAAAFRRPLPKKAQALLAYLLVGRKRAVPRDELAALLWSNSATPQARQSLRQSLLVLRRALPPLAARALAQDDAVTLAGVACIASDIETFTALARSHEATELARADALYRGELLAGLHIRSEPFEDWIRIERERLATLHRRVLESLAIARASAGDTAAAITTAKRLIALDPLNERSTRLLMSLLAESGQGGLALVEHARAARALRDELDVGPDAATLGLAEAIRRDRNGSMQITVSAVDAVCEPPTEHPAIAVLPFNSLTGEAADNLVAEALTEDVMLALGRNKWLSVVSSRRETEDSGARYRAGGTIRRHGERLRVVVWLTQGPAQRVLWSERVEGAATSLFVLQDSLTAQVAARLSDAIKTAEMERASRRPTENATAYDLYMRAAACCRKDRNGNVMALRLLQQAIRLAPDFAMACALAARCHHVQRMMGWVAPADVRLAEGLRLANRALELDDADPEVLWMAGLAMANIDGDLVASRPLIERSIDLNPNSVNALIASCFVLSQLGEGDMAHERFLRAQELNPRDTSQHFQWHASATAHFVERRYEAASAASDRALMQKPGYPPTLRLKVAAAALIGRIDEARRAARVLLDVSPGESIASMHAYWKAVLPYRGETLGATLEGWRVTGMPEE